MYMKNVKSKIHSPKRRTKIIVDEHDMIKRRNTFTKCGGTDRETDIKQTDSQLVI